MENDFKLNMIHISVHSKKEKLRRRATHKYTRAHAQYTGRERESEQNINSI